jgi:hypothetical protein
LGIGKVHLSLQICCNSSEAEVLYLSFSLFGWLVADGWCWFVLREEYCWLVVRGWFVLREKYCWLVADKPNEQAVCCKFIFQWLSVILPEAVCMHQGDFGTASRAASAAVSCEAVPNGLPKQLPPRIDSPPPAIPAL